MSFFNKKDKKKIIAIFDIGSSTVGSAMVEVSNNKNTHPTIIAFVRTDINHKKDINYENLSTDMFEALSINANELYNKKIGAPKNIICVLASPWYETQTKTIKNSRDTPFLFDEKNISELLKKEITANEILNKEKFGENPDIPEIFEKNILNISLNGYQVTNPIGKKVNSVDLGIIVSSSPGSFLSSLKSIFEKVFHETPVEFSSFVLDSFLAIRDRYSELDSYMMVDIGGDVTDITIIKNNAIAKIASFPFGRKTLLSTISTKLDISLRDASELFRLYNSNSMAENLKTKMSSLMKNIEESYAESFYESINNEDKPITVANPLFLTVETNSNIFFVNLLQKQEKIKSLFYNNICTVVSLENKDFSDICKVKNTNCDPFLMIESIAYTKK